MAITYSDPDADSDVDTTTWAAVTRAAGFDTFAASPTTANFRTLVTDFAFVHAVATYAALTALSGGNLSDNKTYLTYGRTAEEDGGFGFWRYDSGSSATANGGTILAIDGGGAGRFFRLFDPAAPVNAQWFGFKVGGGNADATANTTALQAALDANYWVQLPAGTAYINKITHTRSNRLTGLGMTETILVRANSLNDNAFLANAIDDLVYEDFTLDSNRANNTSSGSHGGIRLNGGCSRWRLRRVKVTGSQGTFSGSPVGSGFASVGGGSRGILDQCWFDDCYDGYTLSAHTDARDFGSRLTNNTRNGGLVASASDRFEHHGVYAVGNSTTYGGAGFQIIDTNDAKGYGGTFNSNTLGHGLQHNGSDRCEVHGGTFSSNGISGLDFYDSIDGKVFGGYATSNAVRGIEIDGGSHGTVITGFQGVSNTDVDISVFRTADVQLINCEGNVRAWDAGFVQSATVAAGGTGYTVGDVLTLVGGTRATAATLTVATVGGGGDVLTVTVSNQGNIWTYPTEPASVTGGTGTGATFNIVGTGEASSTCARLQIIGGHRSDTILLVSDACTEVRLTDVKATTVTDQSSEIVSAVGCSNFVMPKLTLTLQNSWVAYNASWQEPVYWKSSERKVRIRGSMSSGTTTAGTVVGNVPAGYRPAKVEGPFACFATGGHVSVYVSTNGDIVAQSALNATLTALNIEYDVAA
jgi:hypothetical protein